MRERMLSASLRRRAGTPNHPSARESGPGNWQGLQIAGIPGSLGNAPRQTLHVADILQAVPELAHQKRLLQSAAIMSWRACSLPRSQRGVQQPVPELARPSACWSGQRPQQGQLHAPAGIHQVRFLWLAWSIRDGILRSAHGNAAQMFRRPPELVAQIMQNRSGRPEPAAVISPQPKPSGNAPGNGSAGWEWPWREEKCTRRIQGWDGCRESSPSARR